MPTCCHRFFDVFFLFLLSSLVVQISCQYHHWFWSYDNFFIRDWPEIQKFEIPLPGFCPIPGDWREVEIPSLARMSLIKFYWILQNARVTAFYRFWVIKGKPKGQKAGGGKITPPPPPIPPRLGLTKKIYHHISKFHFWKLQQSKEDKFEY